MCQMEMLEIGNLIAERKWSKAVIINQVILPFRKHLAMSRDIFGCHNDRNGPSHYGVVLLVSRGLGVLLNIL
jgi:hypothetical protein